MSTGWAKNGATVFEGPYFLFTSSKRLNQLIKLKWTVMFRKSRCEIVPKVMQIGAGILKKWAFGFASEKKPSC